MTYLIVDLTMPNPYGKYIWSPSVPHATSFSTSQDAEAAIRAVPDATGVAEEDGRWYVVKKDDDPE